MNIHFVENNLTENSIIKKINVFLGHRNDVALSAIKLKAGLSFK